MEHPPTPSLCLISSTRLWSIALACGLLGALTSPASAQVASGRAGVDVHVEVPRAEIEAAKESAIEAIFRPIALSIDGYLGAGLGTSTAIPNASFTAGAGLQVGFPIGPHVEPFLRGDVTARSLDEGWLNSAGLSTGTRFRLNPWSPLYFDASIGYAWADSPFNGGAFADFGGGLRFASCSYDKAPGAFTLGTKVRVGLQDNRHATSWFGTLGYSWGGPVASRFECPPEPAPSERLPGRAIVIGEARPVQTAREPWVYEPPVVDEKVEGDVAVEQEYEWSTGKGEAERARELSKTGQPWPEEQRYSQQVPTYEPPSDPIVFPWALGFEMAAGPTQTPAPSYGYGGMLGVRAEIGEHLGLSARYGWLSVDPQRAGEQRSTTHGLFVGPQLRVFTDYDAFEAWRFAVEGGYGFGRHAMPDGVILSADVTREVGLRIHGSGTHSEPGNGALVFELGARFQQGLGDLAEYRAAHLLTGFKLGFMRGGGESENVAPSGHTFGAQMGIGSTWGTRIHAGYLLSDWLVPEVRMDLAANGISLDDDATLGVGAGAKLYLDRWLPIALEAGAGYAVGYGPESDALTGPVADAGIYGWFNLCEAPIDFYAGVRGQLGLDPDDDLNRLMFTAGFEYSGRNRKNTLLCRPPSIEARPLNRPLDRPQTKIVTNKDVTVNGDAEATVDAELTASASTDVDAEVDAEVELDAEPIDWPLSFHLGIGGGLSLQGGPAPFRPGLGVGFGMGVPLGDHVEPRVKASYRYLTEPGSAVTPSTSNFDIGLDVRTLLGPLYLQAGGGHVWQSGDGAPDHAGYFLEAGLGARFVDCTRSGDGYGINVGLEGRYGLGSDDVGSALFVTAGYEWGTATSDLECMPKVEVPEANAAGEYEIEAEVTVETR